MKRVALYMEFDRPLTETELGICRKMLVRRAKGEPLAYIHGEVDFHGNCLTITPDVLIPRQETEILVDVIAKELDREGRAPGVIWDICCGSGCIGLALKRRLPAWNVVLSDISEGALAIARQNAIKNDLDVSFRKGDLLEPFGSERANVIVCNPPYISREDYESLSPEVRNFEPALALIGGETGLEFYERLAEQFSSHLAKSGRVWIEMGADQGSALTRLFAAPPWCRSEVICDWSGKERFFSLEIE